MIRDFRTFDPSSARVILIEGLPRVLPPYPQSLSESAARQLRHLGVEVLTGALVTNVDGHSVQIGERRIPTRTVLWCAGVEASSLAQTLGAPLDRAGRVEVDENLNVPGHPELF